jgi:hypothetical protein
MVAILCFLGAYVAKNYVFDIWIMVVLGLFAFGAQRTGYPTVPMILGLILADLIEANFHRALSVGFGSYTVFFARPISLGMILVICLFVAWPWILDFYRQRRLASRETTEALDAIGEVETSEVTAGELFFAGLVTLILSTFLFSAFRYSPEVRLFPVIVSTTGLALTAYWLFIAVRTKKIKPPAFKDISPANGVPSLLFLGLLVAYALLVPVAGFIVASVGFFLFVMFVSRYIDAGKRWKVVTLLTISVGLFLISFSRLLQVDLPTGLLSW